MDQLFIENKKPLFSQKKKQRLKKSRFSPFQTGGWTISRPALAFHHGVTALGQKARR
jgi:hypothetical protein